MINPSEIDSACCVKVPVLEVVGNGGDDDVSVVARRVGLNRRDEGWESAGTVSLTKEQQTKVTR
jgi:hypothetical protein